MEVLRQQQGGEGPDERGPGRNRAPHRTALPGHGSRHCAPAMVLTKMESRVHACTLMPAGMGTRKRRARPSPTAARNGTGLAPCGSMRVSGKSRERTLLLHIDKRISPARMLQVVPGQRQPRQTQQPRLLPAVRGGRPAAAAVAAARARPCSALQIRKIMRSSRHTRRTAAGAKPHLPVASALHGASAAAAGLAAVFGAIASRIPIAARQDCIVTLRCSRSKPSLAAAASFGSQPVGKA